MLPEKSHLLPRFVGAWMLTVQVCVAFVVYWIGIPPAKLQSLLYVALVLGWGYWVVRVIPIFIAMIRGKRGL